MRPTIRKILCVSTLLVPLALPFSASADTGNRDLPAPAPAETQAVLAQLNAAGAHAGQVWDTLSPAQQNAVLAYLQPPAYREGHRVRLVKVDTVAAPTATAASSAARTRISPDLGGPGCYSPVTQIENVQPGAQNVELSVDGATVQGNGPGTLTLSTTKGVSNSYNATVTVNAGDVSAAVGYSVTQSQEWTYSDSGNMPDSNTYEIVAYNDFNGTTFDVVNHYYGGGGPGGTECAPPQKIGNGSSLQFTGVSYDFFQLQ